MSNPNDYLKQRERALTRKLELIKAKGGKCEICGYDKNIAALDFHHVNPENKSFELDARRLSNTSMEKLLEEADKCILICSNCHREIHNEHLDKSNIPILLSEMTSNHYNLEHKNRTSTCKYCGNEFPYSKGKIYCSDECREADKGYPTYDEITAKYDEMRSWDKVAQFYGVTRRILQRIRRINEN